MDRKERMRQRQQAGQGERSTGMRYTKIFDMARLAAMTSTWFKVRAFDLQKKATNLIDIIPFEITMPWYKDLRQQNGNLVGLGPGDWDYKMELPIHNRVGPNNASILCLREAFGGKCLICDDMFDAYRLKTEDGKKKGKELQTQWRVFYNVYDYDNNDAGEHAWDYSWHLFEKFLMEKALTDPMGMDFWYPADGFSVEFKGREKALGSNSFIEAYDIGFVKREAYKDSIVKQTIPWDQLLIIPTAQEVERVYLGLDANGEQEEPAPERSRSTGRGEPERDRTPPPADRGARQGNDEPPAGPAEPARSRSRAPEPDPPSSRSRDRQPEPERGRAGTSDNPCPSGHVFGRDTSNTPECKTCADAAFELCAAEAEKLTAAAKSAPPAADAAPARRRRG